MRTPESLSGNQSWAVVTVMSSLLVARVVVLLMFWRVHQLDTQGDTQFGSQHTLRTKETEPNNERDRERERETERERERERESEVNSR